MKKHIILLAACTVGMTIIFSSCKKKDDTTPAATPTLYDQVGGTTMVNDPANPGTMVQQGYLTIRSVTDSSIFVIAADTQLQKYFPTLLAEVGAGNLTGYKALSENFTYFICTATGSTNYTYTGLSMVAAHNHATNSRFGATTPADVVTTDSTDFDKFVGDVGVGLAQNGVTSTNNPTLVNALVALLNTTKKQVVQR